MVGVGLTITILHLFYCHNDLEQVVHTRACVPAAKLGHLNHKICTGQTACCSKDRKLTRESNE